MLCIVIRAGLVRQNKVALALILKCLGRLLDRKRPVRDIYMCEAAKFLRLRASRYFKRLAYM